MVKNTDHCKCGATATIVNVYGTGYTEFMCEACHDIAKAEAEGIMVGYAIGLDGKKYKDTAVKAYPISTKTNKSKNIYLAFLKGFASGVLMGAISFKNRRG